MQGRVPESNISLYFANLENNLQQWDPEVNLIHADILASIDNRFHRGRLMARSISTLWMEEGVSSVDSYNVGAVFIRKHSIH